jgi:hypothetical protein
MLSYIQHIKKMPPGSAGKYLMKEYKIEKWPKKKSMM